MKFSITESSTGQIIFTFEPESPFENLYLEKLKGLELGNTSREVGKRRTYNFIEAKDKPNE